MTFENDPSWIVQGKNFRLMGNLKWLPYMQLCTEEEVITTIGA
jgi:hypothetical protein